MPSSVGTRTIGPTARPVQPTDPNPAATVLPLGDGDVYAQRLGERPPGGNTFYRAAPGTPLTETGAEGLD
jgi:hypothetical protein